MSQARDRAAETFFSMRVNEFFIPVQQAALSIEIRSAQAQDCSIECLLTVTVCPPDSLSRPVPSDSVNTVLTYFPSDLGNFIRSIKAWH